MISRRAIMGLGAALVAFGGALAFGAVFPGITDTAEPRPSAGVIGIGTDVRPADPAVPALSGNPLWGVPLKDLSATRERPIFSPARRPSSPPPMAPIFALAAVSKPVEPDRPQLKLVGTIAGEGEGFGIFLDQPGNKAIKLRTGQSHDGWTLRQVRRREVLFERDEKTAVLALPVSTAASNTGAQVAGEPSGGRPRR